MTKNREFLLYGVVSLVISFTAFCSNGQVAEKDYKIEKDFINHQATLLYIDSEPITITCSFQSKFLKDGVINVDAGSYWRGKKEEIYNGSYKTEMDALVIMPKKMDEKVLEAIRTLNSEREFPISLYMLEKYKKEIPMKVDGIDTEIGNVMAYYHSDISDISDISDGQLPFVQGGNVLVLAKVFRMANETQSKYAGATKEQVNDELTRNGRFGFNGLVKQFITSDTCGASHSRPFAEICFGTHRGEFCKTMNSTSWSKNLGVFEMAFEDYERLPTKSPVAIYNYRCNEYEIIDESCLKYITKGFN